MTRKALGYLRRARSNPLKSKTFPHLRADLRANGENTSDGDPTLLNTLLNQRWAGWCANRSFVRALADVDLDAPDREGEG